MATLQSSNSTPSKGFVPPAFIGTKPTLDRRRVAVLPMQNISPDPADVYFADGLTEELITVLSQIKELQVIARTTVSRYRGTDRGVREIGTELRVGSVLEGSVRKSENRIRVTAQLIEVAGEQHVWAETYDRDLDDIFKIQSEIAKHVSEKLRVILAPAEEKRIGKQETESVVAHVACLKGRTLLHSRTERDIREAEGQFTLAIKHDPNYARAYAGLADAHSLLWDHRYASRSESLERSRTFVKKALELDPNLAEARASLGLILMDDYRFAESEKEFQRAISLNPSYAPAHHWYSLLLGEMGRSEAGLRESSAAESLDPLSPVISQAVFMWNLGLGKKDEISKRMERFREAEMSNPFALGCLVNFCLFNGDYSQALEYCANLRRLSLDFPAESPEPNIAYIYAVTGRRTDAQEMLLGLESDAEKGGAVTFSQVAQVYAGLNDLGGCFRYLEKAFAAHERFFVYFRYFPFLEKVRSDPRFGDLLKRADLQPTS